MNIEKSINDVITKKLEEGIVEKLIAENLEKGINNALEKLLGHYGDVTKVIEEKIKSVMLEQLSGYDYSKYIVKLDCILTEILKKTALDNKKILENFKELMVDRELPKIIKVSEIFEEFAKYVAENVDTDGLEVCMDDSPSYENVNIAMEIEYNEQKSWSWYKSAKIIFECEEDEKMNHEIIITKFQESPWRFEDKIDSSIESLRYLDPFKLYLLKLYQARSTIEVDSDYLEDEVEPEEEPQAEFR
ncbi:hypothetical protein [Candidatus Contubernalis alkaliaceticus]|uniref:hypothetical protein n=1 Tax=Candidatus Contubernalis alkaliaceticus TaxID=338645 RepID=UPI001F4C3F9C|nr:hypothetical protein [Candidatus Contubernalis alkalaceticus]UNC91666.1 hypothetical protein HUE98_05905 [Candidatus Contubernalis alkalaceticus]